MSNHTPGPWRTDLIDHEMPYQDIRVVANGNSSICAVWMDDAPVPDFNAQQYANARLIAAAPDLFACVQLLPSARRRTEEGSSTDMDALDDAWQQACKLIAAVEGGAV